MGFKTSKIILDVFLYKSLNVSLPISNVYNGNNNCMHIRVVVKCKSVNISKMLNTLPAHLSVPDVFALPSCTHSRVEPH